MRLLRETASIEDALRLITDLELRELIAGHIDRLGEYDDYQLSELIHIIVVEPADCYSQLGPFIGSTPDVIQEHSDWYELVYVISDDGFVLALIDLAKSEFSAFGKVLIISPSTPTDGVPTPSDGSLVGGTP